MNNAKFKFRFVVLMLCALASWQAGVKAQQPQAPLTSDELVRMLRQLPSRPALKEEIISEIRRRGISFALTTGLRSVVATKSGNDADLRRTLEEAERRRLNPSTATLPSEAEGQSLLAQARTAANAAAQVMPDFVVKQLIARAYAHGTSRNWLTNDRLTVAVSYQAEEGEKYKLLAVNGLPTPPGTEETGYSERLGGTISTGEYVSMLASLFADESKTEFKMVDTDTLRGRRTIVYEYEIQQKFSKRSIRFNREPHIIVGDRGRVWIDRENFRVLRIESIATDIPADYPVRAASKTVDYDWMTIAERQYLLPVRAQVELTALQLTLREQLFQTRNDIRFRNYQKYGSEVRIIDDDDEIIDEEEQKRQTPPGEQKQKP